MDLRDSNNLAIFIQLLRALDQKDMVGMQTVIGRHPEVVHAKHPDSGKIALHFAAAQSTTAFVGVLLLAKSDPNAQDKNGSTALHLTDDPAVALQLLEAGADFDMTTHSGERVLTGRREPPPSPFRALLPRFTVRVYTRFPFALDDDDAVPFALDDG